MLRVNSNIGFGVRNQKTSVIGSTSITPFIHAWDINSGELGTEYDDPVTLASAGVSLAVDKQKKFVALGLSASPYIKVYNFGVDGFGTLLDDPSTLPAGTTQDCVFADNYGGSLQYPINLILRTTGVPALEAYKIDETGFLSKWTTLSSPPSGNGQCLAIDHNSRTIAFGTDVTPYIHCYIWAPGTSGFGSKYPDPASLPPATVNGVGFYPEYITRPGSIVVAHSTSPYVTGWPFSSGGFGTKYSNPSVLPTGTCNNVVFNPAGTVVVIVSNVSPYIHAYKWTVSSGFGTKYSDPSSAPTSFLYNVKFSSDGLRVVADGGSFGVIYTFDEINGFGDRVNLTEVTNGIHIT